MTKKYKFTCSWCGKKFGHALVPNSHGMCPACYKKGCVIRLRGSRTGYQAVSIEIADLVENELGDGVKIICSYEDGTCTPTKML